MRLRSMIMMLALGLAAGVAACQSRPLEAPAADVLVFAAASLREVLDELAVLVKQTTGASMRVSYAASSALAKQVEAGAPADVFISADLEWMDHLAERNLIRKGTRVNLAGNRLVLVAPAGKPATVRMAPGFSLLPALGGGRLAVADPEAVPAGKYAKAALTSLGAWDSVATRLAPGENVRATLMLVSRGEAPLGIVYRTDALADPSVVIVDEFPASSHAPIVYPAALTVRASTAARAALDVLRSDAARAVFERRGFAEAPAVRQ